MEDRDIIICRCEEVTKADVLQAIAEGCHTVASIKRATRAGMGAFRAAPAAVSSSRSCSVRASRPRRPFRRTSPVFPPSPAGSTH